MSKIIQAKDILKAKNYVQNKFDTQGFLKDVAEYFMSHDVSATLKIYQERFADLPDIESDEYGCINSNAKRKGYCAYLNPPLFKDSGYAGMKYGLEYYRKSLEDGSYAPRIYIDKPFVRNAVFALRTLAGYNVEPVRKRGETHYEVTLI